MLGFWILMLLYGSAMFADFLAPYHYASSARRKAYHPPMITWVRFSDASGLRWPYISNSTYEFDVNQRKVYRPIPGATYPIGLFVKGDPYRLLGLFETRVHLFGLRGLEGIDPDDPNRPMLFLLGADNFGRDVLSRLLYGGRISLSVGLIGVAITFVLGMLIGGASGYFGGRTDIAIQRLCEMLMLIPGFYLLLSLRAAIPANWSSFQTYVAIIAILSFIGWAGLARTIRGLVLSISSMDYVTSARRHGGARPSRHRSSRTAQHALLRHRVGHHVYPGYILGESGLSLLGLGIQDPEASLGQHAGAVDGHRPDQIPPLDSDSRRADLRYGHGVQLPRRRPAGRLRPAGRTGQVTASRDAAAFVVCHCRSGQNGRKIAAMRGGLNWGMLRSPHEPPARYLIEHLQTHRRKMK